MKRTKLASGKPLTRTAPLRSTSQALSRSQSLGRGNGRTATLQRQGALQRVAPKRPPSIPRAVRAAVKARSKGRCVVCAGRGSQLHHVLPKQRWPEHALVADCLVLVCPGCHDNHERAHRRIPLVALSACVVEFARRVGLGWYIDATYPAIDWREPGRG
jgi:5-methylcytosine-specific restriction endonuclease McrA